MKTRLFSAIAILMFLLTLSALCQPKRTETDTSRKQQQLVNQGQQPKTESGQVASPQPASPNPKPPPDSESKQRFESAVTFGFVLLVVWLIIVLTYLIWAIHRYGSNYGLSNKEWKALFPEIYGSDAGWWENVKGRFSPKKEPMDNISLFLPSESKPFEIPSKNPYQTDSFGLPPGTIRGIIALTALVMFLVVEGINLYAPGNLEGHFDGLITAFQMVLAFYFGSRAVEVLKAKTSETSGADAVPKSAAKPSEETPSQPEIASRPSAPLPTQPSPPPPPAENSAMAYEKSVLRVANILADKASYLTPASGGAPASSQLQGASLMQRVLALTASFETSLPFPDCFCGTTGNFDGQGISFGALQWNIGQGSLQLLLQKMIQRHEELVKKIFGDQFGELKSMLDRSRNEQLLWAQSIQYTKLVKNRTVWYLTDSWKSKFRELGRTPEMIKLQVENVEARFQTALRDSVRFEVTTERGVALMFDINVQNGALDVKGVGQRILDDYALLDPTLADDRTQVEKLRIIARRRSEVSSVQWREDVLSRKMAIAEGAGEVHHTKYDLKSDFGISLSPLQPSSAAPSGVNTVVA